MYELLLQADKALADGMLDQAEETYWQLVELDPSNAIALAGLARVLLERGDERLARRFADQVMAIDPENAAAGRVVAALEHKGAEDEAKAPDLPVAAARRLEVLSKRHATAPEPAESAGASSETAANGSKTKRRKRHKAGRQAAMPQPAPHDATRHEPHHAMPPGKRRFGAAELRTPTPDAYAAAEAEAAVEAVDALNGVDDRPIEVPSRVSGGPDDSGTIDAIGAEESVAMRLALLEQGADLDEAWLQQAEEIEAKGIEAEAAEEEQAEAEAAEAKEAEAREAAAIKVEPETAAADEAAAVDALGEADAVGDASVPESQADEPAEREPAPAGSIDQGPQVAEPRADELEAAEAEAARLAPRELLEAQSVESGDLVEREAPPLQPIAESAEGLYEKEAETQALREALAIVLGNEGQTGSVEPWSAPDAAQSSATPAAQQDAPPAERSDESATQRELSGPPETAGSDQPTPETEPEPAPRRKKGLFHRFGGR